ncbi:MAG TPA: TIGR04053 family radical SAM/SPASM domain-containing protein, partial [Acidimicrobiales bacterium]|nr:TIGR04053 family radical SAM/SPASM domain-containing protein [Acidimicrobiales bacterium]
MYQRASHSLSTTRSPEAYDSKVAGKAPLLLFWETTKACGLRCRHCRADGRPAPAPGELSSAEALAFLDDVARFERRPVLIMTGGDVMERPDLLELVTAARAHGLPVALAPTVSPLLEPSRVASLAALGVRSVSISLDGASAATHDAVRGIDGHFERTLETIGWLAKGGISVQVNTAVMKANVHELADIAALVVGSGARAWELFFLVQVGRGRHEEELGSDENEDVANFLWEASAYGVNLRTVEGPWCRRVSAWRQKDALPSDHRLGSTYSFLSSRLVELLGPPTGWPRMATAGTRDGKGTLFVAHDGTVYPAGFLPIVLGNVRTSGIVELYRQHPLLKAIRAGEFSGRCGKCEYKEPCGGSRS